MKLLRATRSIAVDYMVPFLSADDDWTQEQYADIIRTMMEESPETVNVSMAWEVDKLKAFFVACAPRDLGHVFLFQVWADPDIESPVVTDRLFFRLLQWAESIGRMEIRAETLRATEAIARRWHFEEYSRIIRFKIPEDFEARLLMKNRDALIEGMTKDELGKELGEEEVEDGRPVGDEGEVESRREASEDGEGVRGSGDTTTRKADGDVPRADGGPADGGATPGSEPPESVPSKP